jgi:hypothetical protein
MAGSKIFSVQAMDGIIPKSKIMDAAHRAGVTLSVTKPQGSSLINGQSVAFWTTDETKFIDELVLKNPISLHWNIGNSVKRSGPGSISGQIDDLRTTLLNSNDPVIKKVKDRQLLVTASIDRADHIMSVLRLKKEFNFDLVIIGGAEAHLVAKNISSEGVPVVLTPNLGFSLWNQRRSNEFYHIDKLINENILVGVAMGSHSEARDLRFLAGNLRRGVRDLIEINDSMLTQMITTNVAKIFKLPNGVVEIDQNNLSNFVLYSENPFNYDSQILLVCVSGKCQRNPAQN